MSRRPTANDFAVLGLRPGAGDDQIRDAYRRLAKMHHPDRNPGDAQALATFQRLTDSYAALRAQVRPRAPAESSPLAAAARRRTSSRRGTAPPISSLTDLPVGGSIWVAADAVLVGPDRAAALRPGATGSDFPTAQRVIRVERRDDGHHVFMPPQPSARWAATATAESEGLAVAGLWVGDRQDDAPGQGAGARMPLRLMTGTVGEMAVDERGWVAADALAVDADGNWSIELAQPVGRAPHRATPVRVIRDADGFRVHSDLAAADWVVSEAGPPGHAPVLTAMLAGVSYAPVTGPG